MGILLLRRKRRLNRAEVVSNSAPEASDLDETPVTEEQKAEYFVPADHPRYLSIEKLGIKNSRILSMGLLSTGELDTPNNIFDTGWYNNSGTPGSGRTLLIDGHNGGPNIVGVFKYLNQLSKDDKIVIERGDGALFTYRIVENNEIPLDEADAYMKTAMTSAEPGTEGLTLISCIGEWSQVRQTYLSRQFVRAVLESKE
ncbi:class F sortase [Candidatus Saccharibacteria bacterium]|nr:class F sortase [Candidatus Saccharibacteria bacterium]